MDADCPKYLGWPFRLVSLDANFVSGYPLVIFLPKYRDDIERRTTRERHCDQFDRLRTGSTCRIVEHDVVFTAGCADELPLQPKRLC